MTTDGVRNPFVYQAPDNETLDKLIEIREACGLAYTAILEFVPACAERTLAIRRLEEANMWANKALVFKGERYLT